MTKIYLTRHGQTKWNLEGRMQGRKNSDLTPLGEEQAKWLGQSLQTVPLDVIITSSSGRAVQTAEWIRGDRTIPLKKTDQLQEIHLGEWEGKNQSQIEKSQPLEYKNFWEQPETFAAEAGEDFTQVIERTSQEVETLARTYEGKTLLLVTHAVVLKCLMTYFEKKSVKDVWSGAFMHSTALSLVEKQGDDWKVHFQGDISHHQNSSHA
ncbi:histidine phosphatase family protein [Halobacillus rhizosphaerae]|uniref:histidine phosphatase family protein n=1 Tax=Halobacillus rhizosphaerae TaxID=3064889 RepID=UPI00398BAE47